MMFKQVEVEVLGVIENMSYFVCPSCSARTEIFSHGGGEKTSQQYRVPFLGKIPLETGVRQGGDKGEPIVIGDSESQSAKAFKEIAEQLVERIFKLGFGKDTVELET
jgi:ATP-binding protein involved in chromosome partitioning